MVKDPYSLKYLINIKSKDLILNDAPYLEFQSRNRSGNILAPGVKS